MQTLIYRSPSTHSSVQLIRSHFIDDIGLQLERLLQRLLRHLPLQRSVVRVQVEHVLLQQGGLCECGRLAQCALERSVARRCPMDALVRFEMRHHVVALRELLAARRARVRLLAAVHAHVSRQMRVGSQLHAADGALLVADVVVGELVHVERRVVDEPFAAFVALNLDNSGWLTGT